MVHRLLVHNTVVDQIGNGAILIPCVFANASSSGRRAILPSSFIISQSHRWDQSLPALPSQAASVYAGTTKHAARLGHQRENVPWLNDVRRLAFGATAACTVRAVSR